MKIGIGNWARPFASAWRVIVFTLVVCATGQAWAATDKVNPVTGETQSYVNKYVGADGNWNSASNWDQGRIPYVSGGTYASTIIDGNGTETNVSASNLDGWGMQLGLFGGAKLTVTGFVKWTGSDDEYAAVDADSKLTISSMNGNNWNSPVKYYVAAPGGVTYNCNFAPANDAAVIYYHLKGDGSVIYNGTVNKAGHMIKRADVTLSASAATKVLRCKPLVKFTSATATFTADAAITVYNSDASVNSTQTLTTIVTGASTLNVASDTVGACQLVKARDGIYLVYVDYGTGTSSVYSTNSGNDSKTASAGNASLRWQKFILNDEWIFNTSGASIADTTEAVALDSIKVYWGNTGDSPYFGGGASSTDTAPRLIVATDSGDVVVGISPTNGTWTNGGSSVFSFSDTVLSANIAYKYYFVTETYANSLSVGDVVATEEKRAARVIARWHGTGSAKVTTDNVRGSHDGAYSITCDITVHAASDAEALVLTTGASSVSLPTSTTVPVIVNGATANGVVSVSGNVSPAGLIVRGSATIIDLEDAITTPYAYFAAATTLDVQTITLNYPGVGDSSVETTLLAGRIVDMPTVAMPTVDTGYIVELIQNPTEIHLLVSKGSNCEETLNNSTTWTAIKPATWVDGSQPTITITVEAGDLATLDFNAGVTAASLTVLGGGNLILSKSTAETVSIGAYDFSGCTGTVTLDYVIDPSLVTGNVTLGAGYVSATSIPAFTGNVTLGTSMSISTDSDTISNTITIPSGKSLSVSGQLSVSVPSGVAQVYNVDGGEFSANPLYVTGDYGTFTLNVRNGGSAVLNGTTMACWSLSTATYNVSGADSLLSFNTISTRHYNGARHPINVSDGAILRIISSITKHNSSINGGYAINLTGATIEAGGNWSSNKTNLPDDDKVKINISGNNTFDTKTYTVTYNHQIADQDAGTPGSLTKTGSGKLTLTAASPAAGTLTVSEGEVEFTTGTWAGSVSVIGGTLTVPGTGATIAGNVTIGSGGTLKVTSEALLSRICSGTLTIDPAATVIVNNVTLSSSDYSTVGPYLAQSACPIWTVAAEQNEGNLSDASRWSTGSIPASGDVLIYLTGDTTVKVNAPAAFGKICVTGTGSLTFGGDYTLSAAGLELPSNCSATMANTRAEISNCTISGGADITVASGNTLVFDGVVCPIKIQAQNGGTLVTRGTTNLSNDSNNFAYGSEIYVETGTATVNAYFSAYNSAGRGLHGNITIAKGATFVNARTEVFDCNADSSRPIVVDVSGTLSFGSTRWTLGNNNKIVLHEGGRIEGSGDSDNNGAMDLENNVTGFMIEADGDAEIAARIRIRNTATLNVDVATGKTLTLSTKGFASTTGKLVKTGDGTLENTINSNYTGLTTVSDGKIVSTSFPAGNVSIASGATYTLKDVEWDSNPERFSGDGTLEFHNTTNSHKVHDVTGVTFEGRLSFTNSAPNGHTIQKKTFLADGKRPQLDIATSGANVTYSVIHLGSEFNDADASLDVRDLMGETGILTAIYASETARNQTINTLQTQDTVFKGYIQGNATHITDLGVTGDGSGVHSLTLTWASSSPGTLTVSDDAKVVFANNGGKAGSWAGPVAVEEDGWLASSSSAAYVANSLTISDKGGVVYTGTPIKTSGAVSLPVAGTVYIDTDAVGAGVYRLPLIKSTSNISISGVTFEMTPALSGTWSPVVVRDGDDYVLYLAKPGTIFSVW